jgi:7,8-dihydroneopterin aldolase/epimerase/oxygenase
MGFITIEDMEFYSFHGHFNEEQIIGNRFIVDLEIETDLKPAAMSDNLDDVIDYQVAYNIVKAEMEIKSKLLENIALRILNSLYINIKGINKATVKIKKMNPPLGGKTGSVSVVMSR